jgi:hypothetical protein
MQAAAANMTVIVPESSRRRCGWNGIGNLLRTVQQYVENDENGA